MTPQEEKLWWLFACRVLIALTVGLIVWSVTGD